MLHVVVNNAGAGGNFSKVKRLFEKKIGTQKLLSVFCTTGGI